MPDMSREEAISLLGRERALTLEMLASLPMERRTERGIGSGLWTPADLLGHLESWEEHLLNAFYAWVQHQTAPIHIAMRSDGLDAVNAAEMARRAGRSYEEQYASTAATRQRLVETLEAISDADWYAPPDPGAERTMADMAGGIIGSEAGPFTHDREHHQHLREFIDNPPSA